MTALGDAVPLILQGIVITFLGLVVYQTGYRWFKGLGSHTFDSKEVAQATLLIFLLVSGYLGVPLLTAVNRVTLGLAPLQQWGVIIAASRVLVNAIVHDWRFNDTKSLLIYVIAAAMYLLGMQ